MSSLRISHPSGILKGRLVLPGSKSESNRLLILQNLYAPETKIEGLSDSSDTVVLQEALQNYRSRKNINIGDAGTAMRFLCGFLASQQGDWVLDGSARMRERPISVLVQALRQMGAAITYIEKEGYPPLAISGSRLKGGLLRIKADVSSQYLSALMMLGPMLENGLELKLEGRSVSEPYIYLTANLMRRMGFEVFINGDEIKVAKQDVIQVPQAMSVEPDWSAASYWFSMAALSKEAEIYLPGFVEPSLQGDSLISHFMAPLGVQQDYTGGGIRIRKSSKPVQVQPEVNLLPHPDLSQSLVPAFAVLQKAVKFTGLQTLRIKETDRIAALEKELKKFKVLVNTGADFIQVGSGFKALENEIETFGDHRMAMGFAPLALKATLDILQPEVVQKSYPQFWNHCGQLGFIIEY
jgi:3-phosphoshikimate 1-carboxyvinyltransferase